VPAVSLATLPSIPYVYSGTTPSSADTCQIITLPNRTGVHLTIHNRDKASKSLRISFDSTLVQDGAAPSMFFTVGEPLSIPINHHATSGFQPSVTLALFSAHASSNYELIFVPMS
jgi:hypothetical protein